MKIKSTACLLLSSKITTLCSEPAKSHDNYYCASIQNMLIFVMFMQIVADFILLMLAIRHYIL